MFNNWYLSILGQAVDVGAYSYEVCLKLGTEMYALHAHASLNLILSYYTRLLQNKAREKRKKAKNVIMLTRG